MGQGQIHKQTFKMKSTCTTKEKRWLMQIECKLNASRVANLVGITSSTNFT
jgi:hypothetical protein